MDDQDDQEPGLCFHRWSVIKRWQESGRLLVIERCRWCDRWKRRSIELQQDENKLFFDEKITHYKRSKPTSAESSVPENS